MFKLTIKTANAAFGEEAGDQPYAEIARILREVATVVERGTRGAPIHDINGNRVGSFDLTRRG